MYSRCSELLGISFQFGRFAPFPYDKYSKVIIKVISDGKAGIPRTHNSTSLGIVFCHG